MKDNIVYEGDLMAVHELNCRQFNNCTNNQCKLKTGKKSPDLFFHIGDTNEFGKCGLIVYCRSKNNIIDKE